VKKCPKCGEVLIEYGGSFINGVVLQCPVCDYSEKMTMDEWLRL